MPTVRSARVGTPSIHYRKRQGRDKNALPVILVQGFGLSSRFWMSTPKRVSERFNTTVVAPDNRGTGLSSVGARAPTMRDLACDVLTVADAENFDTFALVGVSMGSMIAQHLTLMAPERVRALVLMATTPGFPRSRLPSPRLWRDILRGPLKKEPLDVDLAKRVLLSPADHDDAEKIFEKWHPVFHERAGAKASRHHVFAVAGHSTYARLPQITCPTVVVHGEDDALIPIKNGRVVAERIPNSSFQMLKDTGHGIVHTRPEAVEDALEKVYDMLARQNAN